MTIVPPASLFSVLRYRLKTADPRVIAAHHKAWDDWRSHCESVLPSSHSPQAVIGLRIECTRDIPLYHELWLTLSLRIVQPIIILILPNARSLALAQRYALRDGWLSLVTWRTEAELSGTLRQLPNDMPCALLPAPATERSLNAQITKLTGSAPHTADEAGGLIVDLAANWSRLVALWKSGRVDPVSVSGSAEILAEGKPNAATFNGEDEPKAPQREAWVRSRDVELLSIASSDLLIVRNFEHGRPITTAIKPASLSILPNELKLPIPPRFASETMQRMEIIVQDRSGRRTCNDIQFNVEPTDIETWMLSAYLNRGGGGNLVMRAFAQGAGCRVAYAEDEPTLLREVPVVWGVLRGSDRIVSQARAQGLHFYYTDHAYFNRGHGKSYRITRNRYEAGAPRKVPTDRLKQLNVTVAPWRKNGRSIVVCPPTDYFMVAHNCSDWLDTTLAKLRMETDRPIIVRNKPLPGERATPLAEALQTAHALVTHSSNVAIEAACLGIPIFVSPTSAAAPIGLTDLGRIEQPCYPDRQNWLAHLAYSQYSVDEIRNGKAWALLNYLEHCELV